MKIVSWNINSLRKRQDRLLAWLAETQPDVVCLQETKCTDEQFPELALRAAGYHSAFHGQKSYNGVAILSRKQRRSMCALRSVMKKMIRRRASSPRPSGRCGFIPSTRPTARRLARPLMITN